VLLSQPTPSLSLQDLASSAAKVRGDAAKHSAHLLQILIRLNFVHEQQRLYRTRRLYAYATVPACRRRVAAGCSVAS